MFRRREDGNIRIDTQINLKRFRWNTGFNVDKKDWDVFGKNVRRAKGARGRKLSRVGAVLNEIETLVVEWRDVGGKNVKELRVLLDEKFKGRVVKRSVGSFVDVFDEYVDYCKPRMRERTIKKKETLLNFLKIHAKGVELVDVNRSLVDGLIEQMIISEFSNAYTNTHLAQIKAFFKWCFDRDLIDQVFKINMLPEKQADDISLTWEEVEKIRDYSGKLERVRDLFMVGILTGQRYSDYSDIKKSDVEDGFIRRRSKKTLEESVIPVGEDVAPLLVEILERYNWKLPVISSQRFNDHLKVLGSEAGIKGNHTAYIQSGGRVEKVVKTRSDCISSHTARRTFITLSLDAGINPMIVMKVVGITKMETLKKYYKFDTREMVKQMGRVWGGL